MTPVEAKRKALSEIASCGIKPGQQWRHHKGGEYAVSGFAIIEATLDPAVIYVDQAGVAWVRTLYVWREEVSSGVPRFRLIDPSSRAPCAMQEDSCKSADCATHGSPFAPPARGGRFL